MKLNSLTPQKKVTKIKKKDKYIPNVPFSLAAKVSEKYEGTSDNILGAINELPKSIKHFFKESELKSARFNHDSSSYKLVDNINNTYYVIIQETKVGGIPMYYIRIKQNGKLAFRNYTKR